MVDAGRRIATQPRRIPATLTLLAVVYLWLKAQNKMLRPLFLQPVFWMIAINWMLGFFADRFWADWGMPAARSLDGHPI